jgi:Domain of unknown function (DUF1707)
VSQRHETASLMTEGQPFQRDVRASDAEREAAAGQLSAALAEGRLTTAEHAERVEAAYAARTLRELGDLTADLPSDTKTPPHSGRAGLRGQVDPCLLCALVILCPPVGIALFLADRGRRYRPAAKAGQARPIVGRLRL